MADVWDTLLALAGKSLAVRVAAQAEPQRYALDRAQRIARGVMAIAASLPEAERPERADLARIAALYVCIPLAVPLGAKGEDDGSELAADQLKDKLPAGDVELVLRMMREHRHRTTTMPEARLLSDAVALEDIGLVGLWNHTRTFHVAGKTLEQLLRLWRTQQEYGYWETRLRDGLHFAPTRKAAERRLAALHTIFDRMSRENAAEDITS